MNAFVLDTSAYVLAYTEQSDEAGQVRATISGNPCHAPHLLAAEIGNVARRLVRHGECGPEYGLRLVERVDEVVTHWHPHGPLARLAWSVRDRVTFYDALFVALATAIGQPLLTADATLSRTPLPCAVELVSSGQAPGTATPS